MNCPKCGGDISDTYEPDDFSVGILGGWYCGNCDLPVSEDAHPREPLEDDVAIGPSPRRADGSAGTPLSELSSQPGDLTDPNDPRHAGYAEFCRIAATWGYD